MAAPIIRKEALPVLLTSTRAPLWWAMLLLIVIETTVFACLFAAYFFLRFTSPQWPPGNIPDPDLLLPIINTGVLFASSMAVLWATSGIQQGDQRRLKIWMGVGIILEVVFFALKIVLSGGIPFGMSDHVYGSIFWSINRLHTGHVLVAILMASVVEVLAFRGHFTERRRLGIQAVNIYWQFVAVIWIPVFVVLFLVPRWF